MPDWRMTSVARAVTATQLPLRLHGPPTTTVRGRSRHERSTRGRGFTIISCQGSSGRSHTTGGDPQGNGTVSPYFDEGVSRSKWTRSAQILMGQAGGAAVRGDSPHSLVLVKADRHSDHFGVARPALSDRHCGIENQLDRS